MKIFIDPGHGGSDAGAVSNNNRSQEKDITLDIAKTIEYILIKRGFETKLSRDSDIYVGLSKRAEMANIWGADCFVSIHCNSSENEMAKGTETLHYPGSSSGKKFAEEVQVSLLIQNDLINRGLKGENLAVLRLTKMPAVLVEVAFLSNKNEGELLANCNFRDRCAKGISDGVTKYTSLL